MVELFRHAFGLCGEGHLSLIYLIGLGPAIVITGYLKKFLSLIVLLVKSYLGQR